MRGADMGWGDVREGDVRGAKGVEGWMAIAPADRRGCRLARRLA